MIWSTTFFKSSSSPDILFIPLQSIFETFQLHMLWNNICFNVKIGSTASAIDPTEKILIQPDLLIVMVYSPSSTRIIHYFFSKKQSVSLWKKIRCHLPSWNHSPKNAPSTGSVSSMLSRLPVFMVIFYGQLIVSCSTSNKSR